MAPVRETTPITPPATNTEEASIIPLVIPQNIALGEYIFLRIAQANSKLKTVFEIPGDFNLNLLEHGYSPLVAHKGIKLINTCNELNGAYAADAYSKAIDGLSVFISTYGVGELSAINGIANAFTEYGAVLHIVGTPSLRQREQTRSKIVNIHHLVPNHDPLCAPDHDVYKKMVEGVSCIQESLDDNMSNNAAKIDRVLRTIIQERRPGYLFIPCDVPDMLTSSSMLLETPFSPLSQYQGTAYAQSMLNEVTDSILSLLYQSNDPSVLADCLVTRFGAQAELDQFAQKLPESVKLFSANFGRNIDETRSNFVGVYTGAGSSDLKVQQLFENSDFLLLLGYYDTEMNNGGYSRDFSKADNTVIVHPDYIQINNSIHHIKQFNGEKLFSMGEFLHNLTEKLEIAQISATRSTTYKFIPQDNHVASKTDNFCCPQSKINKFLSNNLQSNDFLIVDTMSFCFGVMDIKFPSNLHLLSGWSYGSIGYAVPATFGATMAINDLGSNQRIILVQGDGGAQMTAQEFSSFIRYHHILHNLPKVFLINNDGYTIERKIKGPTRSYNDINGLWKWSKLLSVFGGVEGETHNAFKIHNVQEFDEQFGSGKLGDSSKLQFYEIIADKFDVPARVERMMSAK
ncbi:ARO10 [Candida margitis]|uniref:ARO10 n=1 Tax=Candida margitis TaxID=1775924 RepID=UPI00222764BF|nr:ARO10 [Candida margitis]KAI5969585.1 ARO10 [Candida margitis]